MKLKFLFITSLFIIVALFTQAQQTVVEWNFPGNPDNNIVDIYSAIPNNFGKIIVPIGGIAAVGYGTNTGAATQSAWANTWTNGTTLYKGWEVSFSTKGCYNLDVSSKQRSSATGPRDFKIQYKIGAGGTYIDLPGATSITCADNFTSGVVNFVQLPTACQDTPSVYLRWIMRSNVSVAGLTVAGGGTSRIDEIIVNANSTGYFRSITSGNWRNKTTWQYSPDNIIWSAADTTPTYASKTVTIQTGDTVVIDTTNYFQRNCNLMIDEVYVNSGGELHIDGGYVFINDGPGVDININGAVMDSLTNVITPNAINYINWNPAASWSLGSYGTFIKTRNSTNTYWVSQFFGGVAAVPSTANWVIRKTGTAYPTIPTTTMTFPNLIWENKTGTTYYATNSLYFGCNFNGNVSYTIKGNLEIKSSGLNAIVLYDSVFTNALVIKGDLIINASGNLYLNGDSINLEGNLIVNGNLNYSSSTTGYKKFIFGGGNVQTINAAGGNIFIYNGELNKSANDVTVNKSFTVDNDFEFTNGRFFTTAANQVTFTDAALALGYNNNSFVNGPCTKTGLGPFTFPVGKGADVQPLSMSAVTGLTPFWTENFNSVCTSGCIADGYTNANGTWTMTDFTALSLCGNEANEWFVSCAENGNAVGACSTPCAGNATLHVGSIATSPTNSSSCPAGDCGAAYDHGGWCDVAGIGPSSETDKQIESPIIDCSAQKNITLSFKYMFGGDLANGDSASLWYNDGVNGWTWLTGFNAILCGGGLGQWNNKTISLPAAADFNGNFQIAFRWTNNDDAMGNDPSFAADSITFTGSDALSSEYFPVNPIPLFGNNLQGTLDHISMCEYWDLSHTQGNSNRQVTLNWDANSCGVNSLADLRVARYDANLNQWRNHGNGGTTGTTAAGTITTNLISTTYCPYTLASSTLLNPLPVSLINFNVKAVGKTVELNWQTSSEPENDFFTIQKSKDFRDIINLTNVTAKGNATQGASYKMYDENPFTGLSYYRLKQTDINGNLNFTDWKAVNFSLNNNNQLYVAADVNTINFSITQCCSTEQVKVKIFDVYGRVVFETDMKLENINQLPVNNLSSGIYFLTVYQGETVLQQKFVY